jgi:hypothetical protein
MAASERDRSGRPNRPSAAEDGSADLRSRPSYAPQSDDLTPGPASAIPAQEGVRTSAHRHGEYVRARAAEDDHAQRERVLAARTVAGNARNFSDCNLLLSILGLDASENNDDLEENV